MKSEIYTVYSRLTMVTFQIRNSQTNTPASRISRDFWTHLSYPFIKIQPCFCWGPRWQPFPLLYLSPPTAQPGLVALARTSPWRYLEESRAGASRFEGGNVWRYPENINQSINPPPYARMFQVDVRKKQVRIRGLFHLRKEMFF